MKSETYKGIRIDFEYNRNGRIIFYLANGYFTPPNISYSTKKEALTFAKKYISRLKRWKFQTPITSHGKGN